jgi:hypothetical protein
MNKPHGLISDRITIINKDKLKVLSRPIYFYSYVSLFNYDFSVTLTITSNESITLHVMNWKGCGRKRS